MKTAQDPRHLKRVKLVKKLFAWQFNPQDKTTPEGRDFREVISHLDKVDQEISRAAPEWSLQQINRIDLAILRLAVFELIMKKELPYKVVVDEAVEIAKEFGTDSTPGFINGVLGNIISKYNLDKKDKE